MLLTVPPLLVLAAVLYGALWALPRALRGPAWTRRLGAWGPGQHFGFCVGTILGAGAFYLAVCWVVGLQRVLPFRVWQLVNLAYFLALVVAVPAVLILVSRRWAQLHPRTAP